MSLSKEEKLRLKAVNYALRTNTSQKSLLKLANDIYAFLKSGDLPQSES